jgi:hypothetical protein
MKNLDEFIDQLVEAKGFDTKDPEVITQIKADLMSRLEDRINAMILRNMPEDLLSEFEQIMVSNKEGEVEAFVQKNIPDMEEKLVTELLTFKNMYLG